MSGVILLLIAALIVCDFTVLFVGVIALGVTLVFVIWIYVGWPQRRLCPLIGVTRFGLHNIVTIN